MAGQQVVRRHVAAYSDNGWVAYLHVRIQCMYLYVAEVLRVELLHDERGVLLRLLLQLRQLVRRRAQDDQLRKK